MSILNPAPISTRQFTWDPTERRFVGEISSTRGFGRVYDDACDEGLTLVSARTGDQVVFVIDHVERDADGDVLWWDLRPAGLRWHVRTNPRMSVRLFND